MVVCGAHQLPGVEIKTKAGNNSSPSLKTHRTNRHHSVWEQTEDYCLGSVKLENWSNSYYQDS